MDQLQRNHVHDIKKEFGELLDKKYEQGAAEHGGYIWDQTFLQLLDNALQEAVDSVVYLQTLREKYLRQFTQKIDGKPVDQR